MIYIYGLVQPHGTDRVEAVLDGVEGVTGRLSFSPCGELVLIHGDHDGGEILPRRKALLAHARVLEAAMGAGTVLPMRFGMTCRSPETLETLAARSRDKVESALRRLRDRVEIGVRVTAEEEPALTAALAAHPGLAAARDRLAAQGIGAHFRKVEFGRALGEAIAARRAAAQKALLACLTPLANAHVLKAPETDFEVLRAEFLIERQGLDAFLLRIEQAVETLDFAGADGYRTRMVGPGPAFHFVDLSLSPDDTEEAA